ncbi:MAG TPA: redoxin domain-containing protein [Verrucomicrobiales bacterium]|nr:redoxin domain-containing protein [Verrucomicrobiales bacterium]
MKKAIVLTTLFALSLSLTAGEGWLTNIEKAKELAKKEGKTVLVEFTGSDWCPPCKALKKNVFDSKEFKAYAKKNLVLVELDFPRDKSKVTKDQAEYNREQAKAFAVRGYPTIILMDANGKELTKKVGYGRTSVAKYIESLKKAIK